MAGLPVVAALAKCLPVVFIPKECLIASVRNDMVHNRGRSDDACLQALHAQRISPQIAVAGSTPFASVSTFCSITAHPVGAVLTVLGTVHAVIAKVRTARIAAGSFWCSRHVSPQIKSSPRSSYTEPPLLFLIARSSAITSATAPSTFSVLFSLSIFTLPAGSVRTHALSMFHLSTG